MLCCAQPVSAHHFSKCVSVSTAASHCAGSSLEPGEGEEIMLLPDEIKREGKEEKAHFSGWCGMTNGVKSKDEIAQSGGKVALLL